MASLKRALDGLSKSRSEEGARLDAILRQRLDEVTIEELCTRAHRVGVPGEYAARLDFSI